MWGQRQARRALFVTILVLASGMPAIVDGASSNPVQDYAESDFILLDTTWTGTVYLERGIVVPIGRTLTIENATVLWNTTRFGHFGFNIEPGAKLIVRDSLIASNISGSEMIKTEAYWDFFSKGRMDIQRSTIKHAGDISLELDTSSGSIIKDSKLLWLARGVHVLRTNLTDQLGWDLTMENVLIQDMPIVAGAGTADIGGAVGILNGDVKLTNVTIERARTTALFVDRSSVSDKTDKFGNRVEARDLLVIGGAPPGLTGQGALLYVRTTGSFLCEQCAFVAPAGGGGILLSDAYEIVMRETTLVDTTLGIKLPATAEVSFEGLELQGPGSSLRYMYANAAAPSFERVSFSPSTRVGVHAERDALVAMPNVWWGDATGPFDDNPDDSSIPAANAGTGRPVIGSIDYSGWATTAPARDGLRVTLGALPDAVAPGTTHTIPFTVTNAGSAPLDVALQPFSGAAVSIDVASLSLSPGATGTGALTLTLADTLAASTIVPASLVASAPGQRAAAETATTIGSTTPRIRLDSPAPFAEVDGTFVVSGGVIEPIGPGPANAAGGPPDANGDDVDDRIGDAPGMSSVIVEHDGSNEADLRAAIETAGGHVIRSFSLAPLLWAFVPGEALPDLAARPDVGDVWWDEPAELSLAYASRSARARSSQEGVLPGPLAPDADYAGVWRGNPRDGYQGPAGAGVLMGIIDSGIDPTHASLDDMDDDPTTLDSKIIARISTFTVLATEGSNVALSSIVSPGTHGTWVAGTAAGTGATFTGPEEAPLHGTTADDPWMYAGAAPAARIVDIDAFEDTGDVAGKVPPIGFGLGTLAPNAGFGLALEGFEAVATWNRAHPEDPIRIVQISLSLSSTEVDHPFNAVANALAEENVLVVVAVGNNHLGAIVPATATKVLAVGATRMENTVSRLDDSKAAFSDVSNAEQIAAGVRKPELMAPGSSIFMPAKDSLDGYGDKGFEGTSFAAPIVSGIAALVLEANPDLHAAQVKEILIRSSEPRGAASGARYTDVNLDFEDDLDDGGWDARWGYGYVDAEEAVRLARETAPRSPPTPPTLTLYAGGALLSTNAPTGTSVALGEAEWIYEIAAETVMGDGDPTTNETALLVLAAPTTDLGASIYTATASVYRDEELVAKFTHLDDRISTSTAEETLRLPIQLGHVADVVYRGPDTGRINVTQDLGVLTETGTLVLSAGQALRLVVTLNHTPLGPAPIVMGPGGTRITFPLDPRTLPNLEAPTAVPGISADWDATSVAVHWGPAADDHGIGQYLLFRDGVEIASVSGTEFGHLDHDVGALETHRYRIRAIDIHGLEGVLGPEVVVRTPAAIGRSVVIDIAGTSALATDDAADGSLSSWSAMLQPLRPGRHAARATLFVDGLATSSASVPLTIRSTANIPPIVTLGDLTGTVHGLRSLPVDIHDANGEDDIVAREWRLDDGVWLPLAGAAIALDGRALGAGAHVLEARAIDASGAETTDSVAFDAEPWRATILGDDVIAELLPREIRATVDGDGAAAAAHRLVGSGVGTFDLALTLDGDALAATLPPLASGLLRLSVVSGDDVLAERTMIVDRPPTALILAPRTTGSRLDTLTLADASLDDSGIAARRWTLPDGSTSQAALLALPLASVPVGAHTIALEVTNVNGLTAATSIGMEVIDLAPVLVASPFRLAGAPVSVAYTGETITLDLDVSDPEGDAIVVTGGLSHDAAFLPATEGANALSIRPLLGGSLSLDVTAADPWTSTRVQRAIPVVTNAPPVAVLLAATNVSALSSVYLDSRGSYDPDRGIASRTMSAPGVGSWTTARPLVSFPLGTWDVTLAVTDTSEATSTTTARVIADDWIQARVLVDEAPTLFGEGRIGVRATWFDGTPVEGAAVEVLYGHDQLGFERTFTGVTGADGRVWFDTGYDVADAVNLPGGHAIVATVSVGSRAEAPVQDVETAIASLLVQV